jgi:single-stranded DNA-binding protein
VSDLNVFSCTGRLGFDAETKEFNGKTKARYRVAVGGRKDTTLWLSCDHWNCHPAILQALVKGARVGLTGRIEEQKWTSKDGAEKSAFVLVVNDVALLSPKQPQEEREPTVIAGAPRRAKWETDETPF